MKNLLTAVILGSALFCTNYAQAQKIEEETADIVKDPSAFHHHNIKLNATALILSNISMQYEYGLNRKMSVALGLRYQPSSPIPFRSNINKIIEKDLSKGDAKVVKEFLDNTRTDNWAITPEFRYYFGKKPLNGLYIAPYARFEGYTVTTSYTYQDAKDIEHTLPFKGKGQSITGGLMLGSQWHIGERLLLDLWIAGAGYGTINVDLDAKVDLSMLTQADRDELAEILKEDVDLDATVRTDGASAKGTFPFLSVRTGFCIGITF